MAKSSAKQVPVDPGLVVTLLLATLAAWPFLVRASLPTFTDAEMHAYRTYEIIAAWQAGVPYLRWAPDLFYGFGYPVFNYYSPLSYYLGAAYGSLTGGAVAGVKFVLVLSVYVGAVGMFLFVRDRWGALAGIVSAAAFSFAPYTLYIDPHARGDSPETLAIAIAPLMLWAFARLRRTVSPGDVVLAAVCLAALVTAHNLMALIFFGLLLAWLAWDVVFGQMFFGAWVLREEAAPVAVKRKVVVALGAAVGLGLGLVAFMWLPAVLERDAIQYQNVAQGTFFDFRRYFIEAGELFAPALSFDLSATQMRFNQSVGLAQWVLAGLGALTVFSPKRRRLSVLFFAFASLGLLYLMLPASIAVWEALPPMAFFQFPYRFLGPAAVALGVLAGAALAWADRLPWRWSKPAAAALAMGVCILAAQPLMYPPPWPDFGLVDARRILDTELNGRGIGTTSANDFLPVGARVVPHAQESLLASYQAGAVDKVNRATLPVGTTVTIVDHAPQQDRLAVSGSEAFLLRLYTFYWPGWTAYVDGVEQPIEVAEPEGWINVWVPAGDHAVLLRLEDTPVRQVGWLAATLSLAALVALAVWRLRLPVTRPRPEPLPWRHGLALGAVVVAGMGVRAAADQLGWWRVQSPPGTVLVAHANRYTPLENDVALLAFDLPRTTVRRGAKVPLVLYWQALAPRRPNLRVFIHVLAPDGTLVAQSDKANPADFPMGRWPTNLYVRDEHDLLLGPDVPPGDYRIVAGLWDGETGQRMRVLAANGAPTAADSVVLAEVFTVLP